MRTICSVFSYYRICPVSWLKLPVREICATASSPSTPATLTQACGGSTLCANPAPSRTWCTSHRWNGQCKRVQSSDYTNRSKNGTVHLAGCLFAQLWQRMKWHEQKTCSRLTCCSILMVNEPLLTAWPHVLLTVDLNDLFLTAATRIHTHLRGHRQADSVLQSKDPPAWARGKNWCESAIPLQK